MEAVRTIVRALLREPFPGRDALEVQLERCAIIQRGTREHPAFVFQVEGDVPRAFVVARVPSEATQSDTDGTTIHVLLHVVSGRLHLLEIYREDGEAPSGRLDPERLELFIPPA